MELFDLLSVVLVFAALTAWVNCRFLGLPTTIGVMVLALVISSLGVLVAPPAVREATRAFLERMDFAHALLDVLLAFLLFAGALHVKIDRLYQHKWIIGGLATVGVLVSTFLVGGLIHLTLPVLGLEASWIECLVFGALISPTDPIAVLAILKGTSAPKSLETKIAGESLFNDGIGVVVFIVIAGMAAGGLGDHDVLDGAGVAMLFLREVGGSLVLGLAAGWVCVQLMRQVDQYQVEVLLTLALCAGLYSLAAALHSSGPLAVVVAGLMIGNQGKRLAMS
ncbi:MAG: cation:proton antiporter, partial [Polyangiaceae bacterium]